MCANATEENIFVAHNFYFTYFNSCKTRGLTHSTGHIITAASLLCIHLNEMSNSMSDAVYVIVIIIVKYS